VIAIGVGIEWGKIGGGRRIEKGRRIRSGVASETTVMVDTIWPSGRGLVVHPALTSTTSTPLPKVAAGIARIAILGIDCSGMRTSRLPLPAAAAAAAVVAAVAAVVAAAANTSKAVAQT
jgi:hypothetical protein